ncbi:MAG: hypothetical protein K2F87_04625, partial [Muribaculaceae bacterium]|nr:hypothetical protein [Muribaculaceae bacterium]
YGISICPESRSKKIAFGVQNYKILETLPKILPYFFILKASKGSFSPFLVLFYAGTLYGLRRIY